MPDKQKYDEFGIPIKGVETKESPSQEVDEFGIPIKKKSLVSSDLQSEIPSGGIGLPPAPSAESASEAPSITANTFYGTASEKYKSGDTQGAIKDLDAGILITKNPVDLKNLWEQKANIFYTLKQDKPLADQYIDKINDTTNPHQETDKGFFEEKHKEAVDNVVKYQAIASSAPGGLYQSGGVGKARPAKTVEEARKAGEKVTYSNYVISGLEKTGEYVAEHLEQAVEGAKTAGEGIKRGGLEGALDLIKGSAETAFGALAFFPINAAVITGTEALLPESVNKWLFAPATQITEQAGYKPKEGLGKKAIETADIVISLIGMHKTGQGIKKVIGKDVPITAEDINEAGADALISKIKNKEPLNAEEVGLVKEVVNNATPEDLQKVLDENKTLKPQYADENKVVNIIEKKILGEDVVKDIAKTDIPKETFDKVIETAKQGEHIDEVRANELKQDIENVQLAKEKTPDEHKGNAEIVKLIADKIKLEAKKENTDESFHPEIDVKIDEIKNKILKITTPELVKKLEKSSEAKATKVEPKPADETVSPSAVASEPKEVPVKAEGMPEGISKEYHLKRAKEFDDQSKVENISSSEKIVLERLRDQRLRLAQTATSEIKQKVSKGIAVKEKPFKTADKKYTVTKTDEGLKIIGKRGKKISTPTQDKVIKEYENSIDYAKGETSAEIATKEKLEFKDEAEANKHIAETSENPIEIIKAHEKLPEFESKKSYKDQILDEFVSKIDPESYKRFGDPNKVGSGMAKRFFKKGGRKIDVLADEMSEFAGTEITVEDIVNFVETDKYERRVSPEKTALRDRFKQITGLTLNDRVIQKARKQELDKSIKDHEQYLNKESLDLETAEREFYEAIKRGDIPIEEPTGVRPIEGIGEGKKGTEPATAEHIAGDITPEREQQLRDKVKEGLSDKLKSINKTLEQKKESENKSDTDNIVKAKILPIKEVIQAAFKPLNKFQEKVFGEQVDKVKEWIAKKVKEGNQSSNITKRWTSQFLTSWSNGIPRTMKDLQEKRFLKGNIKLSNEKFSEGLKKLHEQVGNNSESLERIHQVLDPAFYDENPSLFGKKITYEDLTQNEKSLADTLKGINEYVHDWNFSMGLIDLKTYMAHKGKYIARLYDAFEIPEDAKTFLEQNELPIGNEKVKLVTDMFKAREEIDEWKKQNIIRDPVYLTLKRMMQTETNASILSYIDHIASQRGMVSKEPKAGFTKLNGKAYGKLNGAHVPNYIAEDFQGYFFGNKIVDLLYDASKVYDRNQVKQFLKKWYTVFSPTVQLGNNSSNFVFAFLSGIDPVTMISKYPKAFSELKNKGDTYKLLVKNGILGSDVITADLRPLTQKTEAITRETDKIKKGILDRATKIDKKITDLYSGSDDVAKISAFMSLKDYGYSDAKSIELVYNGFQNYATVGKIWDLASKTPLIGNPFIKFQADLQRIISNAALRRPLSSAMFIGILHQLATLGSKWVNETEEEKEIREGRKFIPKIKLPEIVGGDAPLVFQTPAGEMNLARFLSPYYSYDIGDMNHPIEEFSKYLPYQIRLIEGKEKGTQDIYFPKQDPLMGTWWAAIIDDVDFREKSIQDPTSTRYMSSGATDTEKTLNAIHYISRSQVPLYSNIQDMMSAWNYGTDFYGRDKSPAQTILNSFIKIQDFKKPKYKEVILDELNNIQFNVTGYESRLKEVSRSIAKDYEKYQDKFDSGAITQQQLDKKKNELMETQEKRQLKIIEQIAKEQENWNKTVIKYADILK